MPGKVLREIQREIAGESREMGWQIGCIRRNGKNVKKLCEIEEEREVK